MASHAANETIIALGVRVEGDFTSDGNVVIEGDVSGTVRAAEMLRVGERAVIQANVSAANATIAGTVRGNLAVAGRLELLESARVEGDIAASTLTISSGALLNGRVTMSDGKPAAS